MTRKWVVYSSADLPVQDRFEVWREEYSIKMVGMDGSNVDPRPFFAEACFGSVGVVKLARSRSTAMRFVRSRKIIATDGNDDIGLPICLAGSWEVKQGKRRLVLDHTRAGLFDLGAVSEGGQAPDSCTTHHQLLALCLPRAELLKRAPRVERLLLTPFCDQPAFRLLLDYLVMIEQKGHQQDPGLNAIQGEHILDIVAFLLGKLKVAEVKDGGVRAARQAALMRYMERHYRNHGLSVDDVAADLKISRRYVYDLLDDMGESVTQILNRLRLDRARQLLADPNYRHLGIADIALDSGFGDISYFYRQFRRRFGDTPGAFRALGTSMLDSGK